MCIVFSVTAVSIFLLWEILFLQHSCCVRCCGWVKIVIVVLTYMVSRVQTFVALILNVLSLFSHNYFHRLNVWLLPFNPVIQSLILCKMYIILMNDLNLEHSQHLVIKAIMFSFLNRGGKMGKICFFVSCPKQNRLLENQFKCHVWGQ